MTSAINKALWGIIAVYGFFAIVFLATPEFGKMIFVGPSYSSVRRLPRVENIFIGGR